MRILAVDPGDKRLGIAVSDPTGTIANPLTVLPHKSRNRDAEAVVEMAHSAGAGRIVIGQAMDDEGQPTLQGRRAARLAAAIQARTDVQVVLWDESFSTLAAREARLALGSPRHKRRGHLDDLAATIILQSYLDAISEELPEQK